MNTGPEESAPSAPAPPARPTTSWIKPSLGEVKCNIGSAWTVNGSFSGSSWITRNHQGQSLHHSRRAYSEVPSKRRAELLSLFWAVESMVNMKQKNVLFESSSTDLRETLLHPELYPEVYSLLDAIAAMLQRLDSWSLCYVWSSRNRIASDIADSVINDRRLQSYVARGGGGPHWLNASIHQESLGN